MAKQKGSESPQNKKETIPIPSIRTKKKKKTWLWIVLIFVIIGGLIFFLKKPIVKVLDKATKGIPSINKVFNKPTGPYDGLTKEDALGLLEEAQAQKTTLEKQLEEEKKQITVLNSKIDSLKQYEERYSAFEKQKAEWDEQIAKTNPQLFIEQYEKMNPENAEKLYSDISKQKTFSKAQKELATTVGEMEEEQAAKALEEVVKTDKELVKMIFGGMALERRSVVLSAMDSKIAAEVIKILSPDIAIN
ncbi:MAG: hypothetical protein AB9856_19615 [Cellulosilyticaceae bacterium]